MPHRFTLGVEEEFQIVDPHTWELKSHVAEFISPGATSDVCTVQGVRSGPTDAPSPADDAYQHCALCVHTASAGVHAVPRLLLRAGPGDESPRFDGDVSRAGARTALRGARAPPVVYSA